MKKYCKGIPEYVYLVEERDGWSAGPFVKPQSGRTNRKFQLVEVPMDEPKAKRSKIEKPVPPSPKAEGCEPEVNCPFCGAAPHWEHDYECPSGENNNWR